MQPIGNVEETSPLITPRFHWIFDAHNVPSEQTTDPALIERALADIARICGMRIVAGPLVAPGIPENPGLSGICIVDFSHISIHTFSNPCEVCVDVFSCKPYDPGMVGAYLWDTFEAPAEETHFFEVRYPATASEFSSVRSHVDSFVDSSDRAA